MYLHRKDATEPLSCEDCIHLERRKEDVGGEKVDEQELKKERWNYEKQKFRGGKKYRNR